MRNDFDWLARLNRDRKGIWGVLSQYDSVRGGSCISLSTPSDFEKKEIDILIDDDKTLFKDNENIFYELDLAKLAKEISNSAVATERSSVRVIINGKVVRSLESGANVYILGIQFDEVCDDLIKRL